MDEFLKKLEENGVDFQSKCRDGVPYIQITLMKGDYARCYCLYFRDNPDLYGYLNEKLDEFLKEIE